jgi:chromosome segregation ATPase
MGIFKRSPRATRAEVDEIRSQVSALVAQIENIVAADSSRGAQLETVVTQLRQLDGRIGQIGNEVTHQLTELSTDIDKLGHRTQDLTEHIGHLTELPGVVEGVRSDQARLANEQARYEIAFRQDLAEVAEMVMKKRPN